MKAILLGAMACLSGAIGCPAQQWVRQDSGTSELLTDVHFVDGQIGYVTGTFGSILKTIDGGGRWTLLASPSRESFTAVVAVDAARVFVGRNGLFASRDGGDQWNEVGTFSAIGSSIFDIDFVSESTGYLVKGGIVFQTTDGGETWSEIYREEDQWFLDRLHTPNASVLYATGGYTRSEFFGFVSRGFVVRSIDAGETWEVLDTESIAEIMAASWIDDLHGFVFTFTGPIHRTLDGGEHWEEVPTNFDQLENPLITAAQFVDSQIGFAASFDGRLLRTEDGGRNWTVELDTDSLELGEIPLTAIHVLSREVAYAVGNDGLIFKRGAAAGPDQSHMIDIGLNRAKNSLEITFFPRLDQRYRLDSTTNLQSPWLEGDVFAPSTSPWTVTVPINGSFQHYFRLTEASERDE